MIINDAITEQWLKESGFKWHQLERQPNRQWILWLAGAFRDGFTADDELGIELTPNGDENWFCWLRGDYSHRYSRFIHIRHMRSRDEVIKLVEACTGQAWDVNNHRYGRVLRPQHAEQARKEHDRLDKIFMRESPPWHDIEKDESRGGALPEHMQHAIDAGKAK